MKLRDYQQHALDAALADFAAGIRATLLILPTGCGKTVVFSHAADHFRQFGRVLIIAHRGELLEQAARKIRAVTGFNAEVEKADEWASDHMSLGWSSPFIVASIQSLVSGDEKKRMHRFNPSDFSLIIIDECHHSTADSYLKVISHFASNPELRILGVTATGDRADGEGLGQVFEKISFQYEMPDAIRDGWLVRVRRRAVVVEGLDFSACRTTAGDFNQGDLAAVMEFEANLHPVAQAAIESAMGLGPQFLAGLRDDPDRQSKLAAATFGRTPRRALVFTTSVPQAERTADIINRWMPGSARMICGKTPDEERRQILSDYATGAVSFLVNVGIATEGFDAPGIEIVVMARPTKSRSLATQMIGRGVRPADEIAPLLGDISAKERVSAIASSAKPECEIIDFVGNCGKHSLVTSVDVLGGKCGDQRVLELAKKISEEKAVDVQEAIEEAEIEVEEDRAVMAVRDEAYAKELEAEEERKIQVEIARRAHVVATATYSLVELKEAGDPGRRNTIGFNAATDKQIGFLVKLGVSRETASGYSRRQAGAVIESLKAKRCTVGQARRLIEMGFPESAVSRMNFEEACRELDNAAKGVGHAG